MCITRLIRGRARVGVVMFINPPLRLAGYPGRLAVTSQWVRPRCCPTRSTSHRSCGRCCIPATGSAQTRCGKSAHRCGSKRWSLCCRQYPSPVKGFQLVGRLEGAILIGRLGPGNIGRTGDVATPLGAFLRKVRRGQQFAAKLIGGAHVHQGYVTGIHRC